MKRILGAAALLLALAACETAPEPPQYARTDSLSGYELGIRRPEVESRAQAMGASLECDSLRPLGGVRRTRCSAAGEGAELRIEMMNDQVVSVGDAPGAEAGVGADSVRSRLESVYGPVAFTRHGENAAFPFRAFWVAADSSSQLELSCPRAEDAEGCRLITRLSTPREIRRAAGSTSG